MSKKVSLFLAVTFSMVFLHGCFFDINSGKRPYDYGYAKWLSESPYIWFITNENATDDFTIPRGKAVISGEFIEIVLVFIPGATVVAFCERSNIENYDYSFEDSILEGTCKFSPEKLIVKVDKDKDTIFNGEVDEITFIRTPLEE